MGQLKAINMKAESNHYIIPDSYVKVYHTTFKTVYVDESAKILLILWNLKSANISAEEYKEDDLYNSVLVGKYDIEYFISDVTHNKFNITPELQLWYADEAMKKLEETGLLRCGIIMDADLNMLGSLEEIASNVLRRNGFQKIPHRFFKNLDEALKWRGNSSK